ncbi:MAG: EAL domain-containing protein, partial [Campylobacteraceae bacterium]|nr:EAL domain-containing protein [Campylobacteraceae bacterium]
MGDKATILIVDDLRDNRLSIKIALKNENYNLIEAINGEEAIKKCKDLEPDVILMDALMPVKDGYKATKAIRKMEKLSRIPILMITALNEKDDMIKALECGVNDFITKPFDKHELIARCKSYVNLSKINKQYVLATKNSSTNLPNRSALLEDIKRSVNPKLVLFIIDNYELLENFYNEKVASGIVKKFTKKIFDLLEDECKNITLYHINESEFALLKDDIQDELSVDIIYKNCKKLQKNTKNSVISLDGREYNISIVLSFSNSKEHIFENSRIGLSHAVKEGKEIVFANDILEQVHKNVINNQKVIKMIDMALKKDKIVSYFQPIYNNKTKKIEKYESLMRIIDEKNNVISPSSFLEIAKKGKYYTRITKRVLKNSFEALEKTDKDISINISSIDIEDSNIKNFILNFCKKNQCLAKKIIFEFLEDENFKNFNDVIDFIKKVKKYGVKIAIDDFGSGYSNFERILNFQPDILKIDGSLIKNIDKIRLSRKITETIHSFANKMDRKTVAEFVYNQEIFDSIYKVYNSVKKDNGMLIISIDEFGKFLEYASKNNPEKEMYFIQQLAEFVNDVNRNILLKTTLHQSIDAYAFDLSDSQRNEWRKVKGR